MVYIGLAHRERLTRCRRLAVRYAGELNVLVYGQIDHLACCPGRSRQPAQCRPFIATPEPEVEHDELPDASLAVLGMSRGSEAAMLTAIHSPIGVRGVVVTVPGNVVLCSWPPGGPAWLLGARPLAYVDRYGPECEDPAALIPVERVPGPVLLVAAGADRVWPSADMARALSRRVREHGDPHGHTILEYPAAGHSLGYLLPQLPAGLPPQDVTDNAADQAARADAWPRAVTFIRHLRTPSQTGRTSI